MKLTPLQKLAVERSGQDVCVVAGPGSGKTTVLIARFVWLVEGCDVDPTRILAITFTEKAATEIKQRLVRAFDKRPEYREAIERAYVSTIHGFCARLLKEHAIAAGLTPDFTVLDQPWSAQLLRESVDETLDALFGDQTAGMRQLLEALDLGTDDDGRQPDLARSLLSVYEAMRVAGCTEVPPRPPVQDVYPQIAEGLRRILAETPQTRTPNQRTAHRQLKDWARGFLALPRVPLTPGHFRLLDDYSINTGHLTQGTAARTVAALLKEKLLPALEGQWLLEHYGALHDLLREALRRLDDAYRTKKQARGALDFSDLEEGAIRLLSTEPKVRQTVRESFDAILMDELQDTNRLQWCLLDQLRTPDRFFAVGDINQSIYGFRHADPEVFQTYRAQLAAAGKHIDDLKENHRSRAEILTTVERIVGNEPGIELRDLIAAYPYADKREPSVELLIGQGDQAPDIEAHLVAQRIRQLEGTLIIGDGGAPRPAQFRDMAILARTLPALAPFETALEQWNVPFIVTAGRTFFETQEILDLRHLLLVLANASDEVSLAGVLRSPLVGLSDESILRWRLKLPGIENGDAERLARFEALLARLRPVADATSPEGLLAHALDESDYESGLNDRARANIEKFLALLRQQHRNNPQPLAELVASLDALRASQSEAEAPPAEAGNVVRVMSVHSAKGLEFPVVFLVALHKGGDRRRPVLSFSPDAGLGAKWRNPQSGNGQSDPFHAAWSDDLKRKELEEENRLFYVGMTRAREHLVLSYAETNRPTSKWSRLADQALRQQSGPEPRITLASRQPEIAAGVVAESLATPEILLSRPTVHDQWDSTAAVTAIAEFAACPRKYYLGRYLGLASAPCPAFDDDPAAEPPDEIDAGEFGLQVHALLAGLPVEAPDPQALELVSTFRNSELGLRAARAARIEREFDFLFALDGVILRGQIDLWFEEGGELILVDYKTDREESVRHESYSLQLQVYALALEHHLGRLPDQACLHFLRSNRIVAVDLSPGGLTAAHNQVRDFRQAQESLQFPLKEGEQCRRCQFYKSSCPATGSE